MKRILAIIALFTTLTAGAQNIITADNITVEINNQTSRQGLIELRTNLAAQGINFTYNPQFDNSRKLISISYKIATTEGVVLGEAKQTSLVAPEAKSKFILTKQNGAFVATCVNNCN
jgi:ABC-type uncharacterized transport system substrate-binding protein